MKAIITGGMGFIGHNLVRALIEDDWKDWEICVVDDLTSGKPWNKWADVEYCKGSLESKVGDGTYIDKIVKEFKPNIIFHLAAVPRVSYSVEYPFETTSSNVLSTLAVLDAVRKHANPLTRVVFSSSSSIYGGADVLPTPPTHPADPKSPYAMQKWQGEEWCRIYAKMYHMDVVSLRYFNVFGPHSYFGGAYSTVLSAWMYHLFVDRDSKPFLEGDGTQTRDFCFVKNVTDANLLAAMYQDKFDGEAFNVAQGSQTSLLECKALLEKISGRELDLEMRPPRVGDVKDTLADITTTKSVLGYTPTLDFEKQVRVMADWYEKSYPRD